MCTGSAPFTPLPPPPPSPWGDSSHVPISPPSFPNRLPHDTVRGAHSVLLFLRCCAFFQYSFYFPFSSFLLPLVLFHFRFFCIFFKGFHVLSSVSLPSPSHSLILFFYFSSSPSLSLHLFIFSSSSLSPSFLSSLNFSFPFPSFQTLSLSSTFFSSKSHSFSLFICSPNSLTLPFFPFSYPLLFSLSFLSSLPP
jgi:hypothetical protein